MAERDAPGSRGNVDEIRVVSLPPQEGSYDHTAQQSTHRLWAVVLGLIPDHTLRALQYVSADFRPRKREGNA